MSTTIEEAEVQRLVLHGYAFNHVRHFLLTVRSAVDARSFIGSLANEITDASTLPAGAQALAVALTYPGLEALKLPVDVLGAFEMLASDYCQGAMARAADRLGDTGRNEAARWEPAFRDPETHVLVSLYADVEAALDERIARMAGSDPWAHGLSGWTRSIAGLQLRNAAGHPIEPFGFRDGISQPTIRGVHSQRTDANPPEMHVEPGELLLGYPNEDNENRWAGSALSPDSRRFARNGTFVAFRKMQQDVEKFRTTVKDDLVKAKLCGRWPNGALVRPGQVQEPAAPDPADINQFDFRADTAGLGCPFGSHIRRFNPRSDDVVPGRKRLLVRRGMPYSNADGERGTLGLFLCASLQNQFEFLLKNWGSTPPLNPQHDNASADPLAGHQDDPAAIFRIPGEIEDRTIRGLESFVTTRGTLYGFYPSRTALTMIGEIR